MKRRLLSTAIFLGTLVSMPAIGHEKPAPVQGDFTLRNFTFERGEVLPELKLRYCTLGTPRRDGAGVVRNAVLIMHGTTGADALTHRRAGALRC